MCHCVLIILNVLIYLRIQDIRSDYALNICSIILRRSPDTYISVPKSHPNMGLKIKVDKTKTYEASG